jgi:hypothetical protein
MKADEIKQSDKRKSVDIKISRATRKADIYTSYYVSPFTAPHRRRTAKRG